jgi:hypothetical protein
MLSNVWQAQQVGASCHGLCAARYALHGGHLGACRSVVCCVARPALPCSVLPLFFALSCRIVSLRKDVSPVVPCSCCCCSCLQHAYVHVRWCPIRTNAYTRNTMVCTLHECTQAGVIWRWNTGPTDQDFSRSASPWSESGSEDAPSEPSANIPALAQVLAF